MLLGVFFVYEGVTKSMYYDSGFVDNTNSNMTGIVLGWFPQNPTSSVRIYIQPQALTNGTNSIEFDLYETIPANTTYHFNFISPFSISRMYFLGINEGHWSFQDTKNGAGSVVRFNDSTPSGHTSWTLEGVAYFYFTNLPEREDHGSYTLFLPFGGPVPLNLQSEFGSPPLFGIGAGNNFELDLQVPFTDRVTGSFPQYFAAPPVLTGPSIGSLQSLRFELNGTTTVTAGYENTSLVDSYAQAENFAFLFFGLGIPLIVTSLVEIAKTLAQERDRKASSTTHAVLPEGPSQVDEITG
jgi:hypothetical protein